MIRLVVEGMTAYYNRDALELRRLLEQAEDRCARHAPGDMRRLEEIVSNWVRSTREEVSDARAL